MVAEILMGFDESTLAYDLQRAHSADIWFLRARFWLWGAISTFIGFMIGHSISLFGYNLYSASWNGILNLWYHLV